MESLGNECSQKLETGLFRERTISEVTPTVNGKKSIEGGNSKKYGQSSKVGLRFIPIEFIVILQAGSNSFWNIKWRKIDSEILLRRLFQKTFTTGRKI